MVVRNRIVMSPMVTQYADTDGQVSDRMVNYYVARASGGVGLIDTQHILPLRESFFGGGFLGVWDDSFIPGLSRLTSAVHIHGAKISFQLGHPGPETKHVARFMGGQEAENIGPPSLTLLATGEPVRGLSEEEIRKIVEAFGHAARRLKEAGADAVSFNGGDGTPVCCFFF